MKRYIDADELLERIPYEHLESRFAVVAAPTADVAPVIHATIQNWRCTNCNIGLPVTKVENHNGIVWQYVGEMKYCPNCGAKLEGKNES